MVVFGGQLVCGLCFAYGKFILSRRRLEKYLARPQITTQASHSQALSN